MVTREDETTRTERRENRVAATPADLPESRDATSAAETVDSHDGGDCEANHSPHIDPVQVTHQVFPYIEDYAFLSDCETNCLIAPDGAVEWMCVPRPDSPSVFGAILDRSAGSFRIGPHGRSVPVARRYVPGSLVLESTWQTDNGWLVVRDALVLGPWHNTESRSATHRRPPTDWDARHVLVRTVECVAGTVDVDLNCEPSFDYHHAGAIWDYTGDAYERATATASGTTGTHTALTLTTDMRLGLEGRSARARTRMREGDTAFVALTWSDLPAPSTFDEAVEMVDTTTRTWRDWVTRGRFPDHPWKSYLQRSALTLKGLSYAATGALLAAPTTSLPETPRGERNWDYRYTWVRDATFALWGLYTLGFDEEADDFFEFVVDVAQDADGTVHPLQVMYGIGGETDLPETELPHLTGYDGARPVRIGNGAVHQSQHDVWGAMLDAVYLHTRSHGQVSGQLWAVLERQVEEAIARWREPDHGIWEVRGEPQHFVSSKVMCWVALDRGAKLARMRSNDETAQRWQSIADEIRADVLEHGVDERGVFTQYYGSDGLDASALLIPLLRFLPADDERVRRTVLAIADELTENGLVLRYRTEQTDDGMSGEEGAFVITSFWLVSALVEIGEHERARVLCEHLLSLAGPLRLYAEEIEPKSGHHLGNFPQAFTHLALINAVIHVIRAERHVGAGTFAPIRRAR